MHIQNNDITSATSQNYTTSFHEQTLLSTADTILWCTKNHSPNCVSFVFPIGGGGFLLLLQCPLWSYVQDVTHIRTSMKSVWTIFNKGEKSKKTALLRDGSFLVLPRYQIALTSGGIFRTPKRTSSTTTLVLFLP